MRTAVLHPSLHGVKHTGPSEGALQVAIKNVRYPRSRCQSWPPIAVAEPLLCERHDAGAARSGGKSDPRHFIARQWPCSYYDWLNFQQQTWLRGGSTLSATNPECRPGTGIEARDIDRKYASEGFDEKSRGVRPDSRTRSRPDHCRGQTSEARRS